MYIYIFIYIYICVCVCVCVYVCVCVCVYMYSNLYSFIYLYCCQYFCFFRLMSFKAQSCVNLSGANQKEDRTQPDKENFTDQKTFEAIVCE